MADKPGLLYSLETTTSGTLVCKPSSITEHHSTSVETEQCLSWRAAVDSPRCTACQQHSHIAIQRRPDERRFGADLRFAAGLFGAGLAEAFFFGALGFVG